MNNYAIQIMRLLWPSTQANEIKIYMKSLACGRK